MAYSLDLGDSRKAVKSRIYETMAKHFPEIDLTVNTSYDEILINPLIELFADAYEDIDSIDKIHNLDNASSMTEEELDKIGVGNYAMSRKQGVKASTTLTMTFTNLELEDPPRDLTIPAGLIFSNRDGFQYQTTSKKVVYGEQLFRYYNRSTSRYDIDVYVEALLEGSDFNTDFQSITNIENSFDPRLYSVTNKYAVTNGVSKETNAEYAARIKEYYYTRQLNTIPGYKSYIKELSPGVQDVHVVGYGDSEMSRDVYMFGDAKYYDIAEIDFKSNYIVIDEELALPTATATPDGQKSYIWIVGLSINEYEVSSSNFKIETSNGKKKTKISFESGGLIPNRYWSKIIYSPTSKSSFQHMGGKVDIYVKGAGVSNASTPFNYYSSSLVFPLPFENVAKANFAITASSVDVAASDFSIEKIETNTFSSGMHAGNTLIKFSDSFLAALDKSDYTTLRVSHTTNGSETIRYYTVGTAKISLSSPLAYNSITSLWDNFISIEVENIGPIPLYNEGMTNTDGMIKDQDIKIIQGGARNTTKETNTLYLYPTIKKVIPNTGSANGYDVLRGSSLITVNYKVNTTLNSIAGNLDTDSNRNLCADVVIMPAKEIPVEVILVARLMENSKTYAEEVKSRIKISINKFFNEHKLGTTISDEDFLGYLYADENVRPYIAYINKPLNSMNDTIQSSFKIIEHQNPDTGELVYRKRNDQDGLADNENNLPIFGLEYPKLYEDNFEVYFM